MNKLYLYLARRDKKGMKVLAILKGMSRPSRVDVASLGLPENLTNDLVAIVYENRMLWEPWIESADSYEDLCKALKSRGYSKMDIHGTPLYRNAAVNDLKVSSKNMPAQQKTMTKRG